MSFLPLMLVLMVHGETTARWPGFRNTGDSVTTARDLPLQWGEDSNVAWKRDLPGYGQSSPVIWDQTVFVTGVEGEEKEKIWVAAVDLASGEFRWKKEFDSCRRQAMSDYVSKGAPTPVVDATGICAFFESGDLLALDHAGNVRWHRRLPDEYGDFVGNHGLGSSCAQTKELVVVLVDHEGPSYLLGVDKRTGENRWKVDRPSRVSWSTPLVAGDGDGERIFISSNGVIQAFDLAGKELWSIDGIKGNTVASPTLATGPTGARLFVGSSDVGNSWAIGLGNDGVAGPDSVAWRADKATCSFGSPLVYRDVVYLVSKAQVAFALDATTGKELWSQRLPASCWASPMAVDDRIYFFTRHGTTVVARAGQEFEKLAENPLAAEDILYGIAAVDGAIVLRTGKRLIRVGQASP